MDSYARFYDFIVALDELPTPALVALARGGARDREREVSAVELGCGTGRLLLPLAERGIRVTGVDLSRSMLAIARTKLEAAASAVRERVALIQGDMREPRVPDASVDLVYLSSNTLALLPTPDDIDRALLAAARSVAPGGALFVEQFYPPGMISEAFRQRGLVHVETRRNPATGLSTARFMSFLHDAVEQRVIATTFIEEFPEDGPSRRTMFREVLRYCHRVELELRVRNAGFDEIRTTGGHDGEPLTPTSLRMVLTARRRPA